eukprot:COSAG01_NODE_6912_length_3443_cov_2.051136_5_plen_232_part_00
MRYTYHNFSENFKAILKTKDMNVTRELMLSELTKVIEGRPAEVSKALIGCGVSINARPTKRDLVGAVAYNLTDLCVRTKMMELIVANQLPFIKGSNPLGKTKEAVTEFDTDVSRDAFMNQTGPTTTPPASSNSFGTGEIISTGVQLFGTIVGIGQSNKTFKNAEEQRAHELQLAKMNQELMLKQMNITANQQVSGVTESRIGGGNTITYILLGIGAIAIIGFSIYSSRKNK